MPLKFLLDVVLTALFVFLVFLGGLWQIGGSSYAQAAAVICGLVSAIAWGFGSIGGPADWNNGSNIIAAVMAAASLGFFTSTAANCDPTPFAFVCHQRDAYPR